MSLHKHAWIGVACVCGTLERALAQDACWVPLAPPPPPAELAGPARDDILEIIARGGFELDIEGGGELYRGVEMRYGQRYLSADRATFDRESQRLDVSGRVTYRDPDVTVFGEDATFDTATAQARVGAAGFEIHERAARGNASRIVIRGDRTMSLASVDFTTCPPDRLDWQLLATDIDLDADRGFGTARRVRLEFKGVPILYTPVLTFPIDDRRKSGFLTPSFAERRRTGLDIAIPYYLNLAPSYDMTLEPRYLSRRGLQLNTEFRYLMKTGSGQIDLEYLPDDRALDEERRYVNLQHESVLGRWQVVAGIEDVSDDAYFSDFATSLEASSRTHLNRFVAVSLHAPYWSVSTRLQNYQTIDTLIAPEDRPYERVPQVLFEGAWSRSLVGFESNAELALFERDVGATGWRLDTTQEVAVRLGRAGMFLTPAVALRQTNYWLDDPQAGSSETFSRTLPIASLDAGLKFERDAAEGRWVQTLEPRLLYVHVPFEDQSELPVFDTIEPDFNLVQLFRKARFLGADRVSDADQLSLGVTTRLIESRNGRERLTATIGQTRYLSTRRVTLPEGAASDASASDYIAEVSIGLPNRWSLDLGYQWSTETESTARTETRFTYRPQEDRLFGFGYRYRSGLLEQGDVSLVWPATQRWRIIGRYSYSLRESEPLEQFVGWEYDGCCWRLRMVGRRYVSRRTGEFDRSISLQLELKGLSQRVTAPEALLDRGILGYRTFGDMP